MKLNLYYTLLVPMKVLLGVILVPVKVPGSALKRTPVLTLSMASPLASLIPTVKLPVDLVLLGILSVLRLKYRLTKGSK